jgi:hypothetical protein
LRKPLFLSIFGLVAVTQEFEVEEWQQKTTDVARRKYLFDCYWEVVMDRALVSAKQQEQGILSKTYGKKSIPNPKAVQRALVFAAKALEQESQTELLIEGMQPYHLRDKLRQWQYWLFLFLGNLLASGTIATLVLFQWSQLPYPPVSWSSFLKSIVLLGLPGGFILSTESKADGARLIMYPFVQVYCSLLRKKLPTEFRKYIPILHDINLYLRFRLKVPSFKDLKNEVFKPSVAIACWMSDYFWMPLVPLIMGIHELSGELASALGWKRLGRNLKESFDLIIQNFRAFANEVDESRYPHHIFLGIITFQYVQMIKLRGGWLLNLAFDILTLFPKVIILIIEILLNLVSVLVTEEIEIEKSLTPNYGFKEALRTAFLISILFCISSFMACQMPAMYYGGISFVLGFLACYSYLPLIKHLSLRLVLWQSGTIPWNYGCFLNYCTERLLLQRIGGRYRFMHKLLQDHFAKMDLG